MLSSFFVLRAEPSGGSASTGTKEPSPRLVPLDVLRAVAIFLVMGFHPVADNGTAGSLHWLATGWKRIGWSGVDLFFVLSGFLVGGLLFREIRRTGDLDVRRFLVRRGFKIWPSYFAYLLAFLVAASLTGRMPLTEALWALFPNLIHLQNYLGTPRGHTWSLAVEEHFYLILPLLLAWAARNGKMSRFPLLVAGVLVTCFALRLWRCSGPEELRFQSYLFPTHLRLDGLMFGALIAWLHEYEPDRMERFGRHTTALLAAGVALVLPMLFLRMESNLFVPRFGFAMLYVGYGLVMIALLHCRGALRRAFDSAPLRAVALVGSYSYPIYLWHEDAGARTAYAFMERGWVSSTPELYWLQCMGIYVAAACAAGVLLSLAIEQPALSIRDRLFPRDGERRFVAEGPPG
jgi:peptidoglycan/LPS O-acetylase OafA/YrhL